MFSLAPRNDNRGMNVDLKVHIGLKVRGARRRRGLTQEQLADKVGKTVETISNIERGHTLTGLDTLERLSLHLDVHMREFFEEFQPSRKVRKVRIELEEKLKTLALSLSDDGTRIAVEVVEVLAKHRALSAK
jgi:transcriptional regulator with XRE-family HTH domain